jgi:hypothetical protein
MKREDIIHMAREAGIANSWDLNWQDKIIERFATLVASAEREACAKLAMTISEEGLPEEMPEGEELILAISQITGGVLIADAIRARGQA